MFLLPLLTGFLLAFYGHGYNVHGYGSRNAAAQELEDYNKLLDDLSSRYKQILDVQHKRQQLQKHKLEGPNFEWTKLSPEDDDVPKEVNQDGINLAAADRNSPGNGNTDSEATNTANENNDDTKTKPETSTASGSSENENEEAPVAHKLVAQPSGKSLDALPQTDFVFIVVVTACSVAGLVGLIMAGVCWYKLHSRVKAASDVDYPAYGVTGPTKERLPSPGDRKLAQSAQMYHYQHQKQQMIAMEKANGEMKQDGSEDESEEENEEGDYTVYECPGLAPTGEMEVRNPLFTEETQTPVNGQPVTNGLPDDKEQE